MIVEFCKTMVINLWWILMAIVALSLFLHVLIGFVIRIMEFIDELRNK